MGCTDLLPPLMDQMLQRFGMEYLRYQLVQVDLRPYHNPTFLLTTTLGTSSLMATADLISKTSNRAHGFGPNGISRLQILGGMGTCQSRRSPLKKKHTSTCWEEMGLEHMGVSKNRATPKSMVYNGKPLFFNGWFGGKNPTIFGVPSISFCEVK